MNVGRLLQRRSMWWVWAAQTENRSSSFLWFMAQCWDAAAVTVSTLLFSDSTIRFLGCFQASHNRRQHWQDKWFVLNHQDKINGQWGCDKNVCMCVCVCWMVERNPTVLPPPQRDHEVVSSLVFGKTWPRRRADQERCSCRPGGHQRSDKRLKVQHSSSLHEASMLRRWNVWEVWLLLCITSAFQRSLQEHILATWELRASVCRLKLLLICPQRNFHNKLGCHVSCFNCSLPFRSGLGPAGFHAFQQ